MATSDFILKFRTVLLINFRNTFGRFLNGTLLVFFDEYLSSDDDGDFQLWQNMFRPCDGERCCLSPWTLSTAEVA